jgi:hypothetical protein
MRRAKLYGLVLTACVAGFIWLAFTDQNNQHSSSDEVGVCMFKHVTGIPCPSCGSTRTILSIMHGNLLDGMLINPFGIILMLMMILSPAWIVYDLISRRDTFLRAYLQTELFLKKKWIAFPAITLVLGNWIWNIYKGL